MEKRKNIFTIILILLLFISCKSQTKNINSKITFAKANYSFCENYEFIDTLADTLLFVNNISKFYEEFQKINDTTVTIVHIGDSHLQAGFLGVELRKKLSLQFGNAGRGLIFPFNLYKSNQPYDFSQNTNIEKWYGTNIVQFKQKFESGINGAVLQTEDTGKICFTVKNNHIDNSFDKITIFIPKLDSLYDFALYDANLSKKNLENFDVVKNKKQYFLDSLTNNFCIEIRKTAENQKQFLLHGILLEKQNSNGILYNDVGINGATINHYNKSPQFFEQLKDIKPSLIIISLGSNDVSDINIKREIILIQLKLMIDKLREAVPNVSIIITTPVHHFYRKTTPHTKLDTEYCFAVYDAAIEKRCAVIDLYGIGGGYGSCYLWGKNKLLQNDGLHFTVEGYRIQALLIYNAIINGIH